MAAQALASEVLRQVPEQYLQALDEGDGPCPHPLDGARQGRGQAEARSGTRRQHDADLRPALLELLREDVQARLAELWKEGGGAAHHPCERQVETEQSTLELIEGRREPLQAGLAPQCVALSHLGEEPFDELSRVAQRVLGRLFELPERAVVKRLGQGRQACRQGLQMFVQALPALLLPGLTALRNLQHVLEDLAQTDPGGAVRTEHFFFRIPDALEQRAELLHRELPQLQRNGAQVLVLGTLVALHRDAAVRGPIMGPL